MNLKIENLTIVADSKIIIDDFSFTFNKGTNYVITGPNGAGKSSLFKAMMGHPDYQVIKGKIYFENNDITNLETDQKALLGIFLSMQTPFEIEGLNVLDFIKTILNKKDNKNYKTLELFQLINNELKYLNLNNDFLKRSLNVNFSGGEKKRSELLQFNLLNPKVAIFDEIDSGLDVDGIKLITDAINKQKEKNKQFSLILISHYLTLIDDLQIDQCLVIINGKLVEIGKRDLVERIHKEGYNWIYQKHNISLNNENYDIKQSVILNECAINQNAKS